MFNELIDFLRIKLESFGLFCNKFNSIYYFESIELNIAFDVFIENESVVVDLVCRKGVVDNNFILMKYTNLNGNKVRLITSNVILDYYKIYDCIKSEYLELIFLFNKYKKNSLYSKNEHGQLILKKPLKCWFYDVVPNFGDFMTPWLANHFTNRPVLNVRNLPSSEGAILGVGSIVQGIDVNHKNAKVWGSGIISAHNHLNVAKKLKKSNLDYVYACRGELTKGFFKNYGFDYSNVLGDPGLLFGQLYQPKSIDKYKFAIIPHYIHYKFFKDLELENCIIVNVRDELTSVLDQIASAEKIISTSMHGLIIAQSYNIPWLHLYINDGRQLVGEEFKFEDFFSILERDKVAQCKIGQNEIDVQTILNLFDQVSLPKFNSNYSSDALIESFYDCLEDKRPQKKNLNLSEEKLPQLLFLGDSHISYFKYGAKQDLYAPFKSEFCMASGATASGLENPNSFTQAAEKFKDFIFKYPKSSEIIFQLGEVDCGILIWLKAKKSNISIDQQIKISLEAYESFLNKLIAKGYKNIVITSATLPTINDTDAIGEIISIRRQQVQATFEERTALTHKFNVELEKICEKNDFKFIDASNEFWNAETKLCDSKFRNKDLSDHHMDNLAASPIWATKLCTYLFAKYNIKRKKINLMCTAKSLIKTHKIPSKGLVEDMYLEVKKNDLVEADQYYFDSDYFYLDNVRLNGNKVANKYRFLYFNHFIYV